MDWLEVSVRTTTSGAEIISEALISAGCGGTTIEDRNDILLNQRPEGQWDIIDEDIIEKMDEDVLVKGYFQMDERISDILSGLKDTLAELERMDLGDIDIGKATIETSNVNEADWADNWKKYYKPFRVGESFVIKPTWESYEAQPDDRIIEMDPGMAFGTGTHETTSLCLELVEKYVKPGIRALDIGSGTGILSIGAALCGADRVTAIDIDPMAVRITGENTVLNGVSNIVRSCEGNLLDTPLQSVLGTQEGALRFDLVCANIIADIIIKLSPTVSALMADKAVFIASGIIIEREDDVRAALEGSGFSVIEVRRMGSWCAIAAGIGM